MQYAAARRCVALVPPLHRHTGFEGPGGKLFKHALRHALTLNNAMSRFPSNLHPVRSELRDPVDVANTSVVTKSSTLAADLYLRGV
jgi:hypothetical protein